TLYSNGVQYLHDSSQDSRLKDILAENEERKGRKMEALRTTTPTILVVDDEVDICLALSDLLESEGYRVETVQTGSEALRRVSPVHSYSAVILDLGLPDLDGLIVLQRLYG